MDTAHGAGPASQWFLLQLPWARRLVVQPAQLGCAALLWVAPALGLTLIPPGKGRREEAGAELAVFPQRRPAQSPDRADKRGRQRRKARAATAA